MMANVPIMARLICQTTDKSSSVNRHIIINTIHLARAPPAL